MRILSWNIQWGRGIDGRVDLARTAGVIRGFDADVICLQEVAVNHPGLPGMSDPEGEDQLARLARLFPAYAAIYGAGADLPGTQGAQVSGRALFGELILSRLPLLQVFRHLLPWPADPAVPSMQRVAVEAVVDTPFGAMRVVTTHLEYYSATQRAAQVEFLRGLQVDGYHHAVAPRSGMETDPPFAVLPRGEFAVFCGDFNSAADAPEHARMQEPMDRTAAPGVPRLVDAWSIAHPAVSGHAAETADAVPRAPTFGVHDRSFLAGPATYDFFFVSENLAPRVAGFDVDAACAASDHQPVLLTLN